MGIFDRFGGGKKASDVDANPFDALENAIQAAYPNAELTFFGEVKARTHALNGFIVIRHLDPVPHWLIVSQGFTELWEKESDDRKVSGWGFELTCRVPAPTDEHTFGWVFHWMQHIVDSLEEYPSHLEAGHTKDMAEPTTAKTICSVVFAKDTHLRPTKSKNGRFEFLQMIGLNSEEVSALRSWNSTSFVKLMREHDPLSLIDEASPGLLEQDQFVRRIEEGRARDGSSVGMASGADVLWLESQDEIQIHFSRDVVRTVEQAITGRLAHKMPMILMGDPAKPNALVVLEAGSRRSRIETREGSTAAVVSLDAAGQAELLEIMLAERKATGRSPGILLKHATNVRVVVVDTSDFRDEQYPF